MARLSELMDFVLHMDRYLGNVVHQHGLWSYAILFTFIFLETGIVIMPFLPGDSLLFAAGAIVPICPSLDVGLVFTVIVVAAILGDTTNYYIGKCLGPKVLTNTNGRLLNRKYLDRAQKFYEKHGGKTILLARFIPIIRTFAPFVAGVGRMEYTRFLIYNIVGALVWAFILVFAGYFFGQVPWVKNNFSFAILAIVVISLLPMAIGWIRHRIEMRRARALAKEVIQEGPLESNKD